MATLARILIGIIALLSVLPLFPVGTWWVRLCDAPRIQIGTALLVPLVLLTVWGCRDGWSIEPCMLLAICLSLAAWQFSQVLPYTTLWRKELPNCADAEAFHSVTVVNLKFENDEKQAVFEQLWGLDSDLLLLIEYDQAWADGLAPLKNRYDYSVGVVLEEGLGLMLWSKLPLLEPEVRYLVSNKRPSIFTRLDMADGRVVHFVGVHPTPPGLWDERDGERHDSRIRDAELLIIAESVAENPERDWLITGDFNDVAWSHTTRMFQRISGLNDPRVGRGLYSTYHAAYPPFRVPIDQVFLSPTARIKGLERVQPVGSDHFAITTKFCLEGQQPADPDPEGHDLKQAAQMIQEGAEDANEPP